jgi:hypothetical protein
VTKSTKCTDFIANAGGEEAAMVETRVPPSEQGLSDAEEKVLAEVLVAMRAVRHGEIRLAVQDSRVIQIDRTEKHRLV